MDDREPANRKNDFLLARALLSFLLLPGLVGFIVPALIARADARRGPGTSGGLLVLAFGLIVLVWCVRDFYVSGRGTLAPWDPPRRLVAVGLYRYVRNPMYVGVLGVVAGWALLAGSRAIGWYAAVLAIGFHLRVIGFEEPWLARTFEADWREYSAAVRRWMPRLTPWRPPGGR